MNIFHLCFNSCTYLRSLPRFQDDKPLSISFFIVRLIQSHIAWKHGLGKDVRPSEFLLVTCKHDSFFQFKLVHGRHGAVVRHHAVRDQLPAVGLVYPLMVWKRQTTHVSDTKMRISFSLASVRDHRAVSTLVQSVGYVFLPVVSFYFVSLWGAKGMNMNGGIYIYFCHSGCLWNLVVMGCM